MEISMLQTQWYARHSDERVAGIHERNVRALTS